MRRGKRDCIKHVFPSECECRKRKVFLTVAVKEILQEAEKLSMDERKELIKALIDMLIEQSAERTVPRRSIRQFRGIGAHLYDGTDAQAYIEQIRRDWDQAR